MRVARSMFIGTLLSVALLCTGCTGSVSPVQQAHPVTGTVQEVVSEKSETRGDVLRIEQRLHVRLDDGDAITVESSDVGPSARLAQGQRVIVERLEGGQAYVRERYRLPQLVFLVAMFCGLGIVLAGWRGMTSIIGLIASVALVTLGIIPAIARGADPFFACLIGACGIAVISLTLAHGFHRRTFVSLLSTLMVLAGAALLSWMAVHVAQLFGQGSEAAAFLQTSPLSFVDVRGLVAGGFLLGALGVLDDITTGQTAAIEQMMTLQPQASRASLWTSGMIVGREHIASLINTLALAYIGVSLPSLLLLWHGDGLPFWVVANSEAIAEEIIRTLVGSSALLLAVPVSTWFAVRLLKPLRPGSVPPRACCPHVHVSA